MNLISPRVGRQSAPTTYYAGTTLVRVWLVRTIFTILDWDTRLVGENIVDNVSCDALHGCWF